jgi:hypothetical protein
MESSECEQLRKVTTRHACIEVVELGFAGDATIPVYVPSILTKGSLPRSSSENGSIECKEEPLDENFWRNYEMDDAEGNAGWQNGLQSTIALEHMQSWPDTDDDFEI